MRLILAVVASSVLLAGCGLIGPDQGADQVTSFFQDLEAHRYEAAVSRIRRSDAEPLPVSQHDALARAFKKAYDAYAIHFTTLTARRDRSFSTDELDRFGAAEGSVYRIELHGSSNSPCVPLDNGVIYGSHAGAARGAASGWFLPEAGMIEFFATCPGG